MHQYEDLNIIDGGSNKVLAGAGVHLYKIAESSEHVKKIRASDYSR